MAGLGLALAFVGRDPRTADERFTFGTDYLLDGLAVVPVLLGLFAIAEIMRLVAAGAQTIAVGASDAGGLAAACAPACWRSCGIPGCCCAAR